MKDETRDELIRILDVAIKNLDTFEEENRRDMEKFDRFMCWEERAWARREEERHFMDREFEKRLKELRRNRRHSA
jgi:hypothetical protein